MGKEISKKEAKLLARIAAQKERAKLKVEKQKAKRLLVLEKKRAKIAVNQVDGITPRDVEKISKAIREIWSWSNPRKLCIARATDKAGFARCENKKCKSHGRRVPKVYADHIQPLGNMLDASDVDYIRRTFTPSRNLQALCKPCHDKKTRDENRQRKFALEAAEGFL